MDISFPSLSIKFIVLHSKQTSTGFVDIDSHMWPMDFCVSSVYITLEVFLNEIWSYVYFTVDNWSKVFSAISIYGILCITYMKIVIKFLPKYVNFYIWHRNLGTNFLTYTMKSLHFRYRNLWTGFHTWSMRFSYKEISGQIFVTKLLTSLYYMNE